MVSVGRPGTESAGCRLGDYGNGWARDDRWSWLRGLAKNSTEFQADASPARHYYHYHVRLGSVPVLRSTISHRSDQPRRGQFCRLQADLRRAQRPAGELPNSRNQGGRRRHDSRIASPELALDLLEARGRVDLLEQRAAHWQKRLADDDSATTNLAVVLDKLAEARSRERILRPDAGSLVCSAKSAGLLLPG